MQWYSLFVLAVASACSPPPSPDDADAGPGGDAAVGVDAGDDCACTAGPHGALIYVISSQSEIYSYNPLTNEFAFLAVAVCSAGSRPYSMAIDQSGVAWILFVESRDIGAVDLNDPSECFDPGFVPGTPGFEFFGMAFSAAEGAACPDLYAHSYSGDGPFAEGPDIGSLGMLDGESRRIVEIASVDYDGGELAGTGDGRLFAFTGVDPAKLVEYDKSDGAVIDRIELTGFSKTNASAFAFFAGEVYFFTEAQPAGCAPCLDANCPAEHAACLADEYCTEQLTCAVERANIDDLCGGGMPQTLQNCLIGSCGQECMVPPESRVSQVTRLDLEQSQGQEPVLTVVHPEAPIRIVGAGASTCVPYVP